MASNSKVFIDANVLIEILEYRPLQQAAMQAVRSSAGKSFISVLTCHIVGYVSVKRVGLDLIEAFLADYKQLDLLEEDVAWAFANRRDDDFEDALQVAVAIRNGCDVFVTFDRKLAKHYADLVKIKLLS